ncbi:MAG: ribosome recycling factor [Clostridia bacterium]|nr:ribosome recycling factor [Clostridia bacterium]MBQ2152362.1 ribosome recycling factor [Clostridia bacterium]MBQ5439565.1 ribosome recycling factor [Clostridia bacterium]
MKETLKKCEERMNKRVDHLEVEYREIRAGRANPNILDRVMVDYYGAPTAINALAAVSVTEARTLTIQPWDASVLRGIERAIQASDIGINPQNDGKIIRLVFPPLTEDKRKDIVKDVAKMAEAKKVHIRNIRRDTIEDFKKMKKEGEITEDDLKKSEKKVQELTDKYVKSIDQLCEAKQKEVMSI